MSSRNVPTVASSRVSARRRLSRIALRAGVPLVALMAACGGGGGGGGGCGSCLAPIPGGFPTDSRRHENAIQVRATHGAIQYLSDNGTKLVGSLLPGGSTTYAVPACPGGGQLCCGSGNNCGIDIGVNHLQLAENPSKALALQTRVALKSMNDVQVSFTVIGLTTHCHLNIDTSLGQKNKDIGFNGDLTFAIDAGTDLTSIVLENTKIVDLEPAMLKISPVNQLFDFGCTLGNIGFVQDILVGQIASQVSSQVNSSFCSACKTKSDCDGFADDCKGGQCMRKGKCIQEVGAQGRLDLASLAALFAGTGAGIDILAALGGYAETLAVGNAGNGGGLSLGMLGGGQASAHNPCVPMRPAPTTPMVGRWSQEKAAVEPRGMKPYHVGIGVHQSHLDTLAWAAFDSGALCLNVGTAQVAMIDSKLLGVILPSMNDLTHGVESPMVLAVRPQQPPTIKLGEGTFDVDPMTMKKTIKDPLLHVNVPQLSIDFYALVEERYVRLMTLTADVALGVALDSDEMGRLVPMLSDLNGAFTNVKVTNSELLAEAPDRLAKTFPTLLGLAAGQLGNIAPIALPKVMGLDLSVVAIEPTDNLSFLSIFANISASPDAFHATTLAEVSEVLAPPTSAFRVEEGLDPLLQPRVVVRVDGRGHGGDASDLEWSARLDGGLWMPWQSTPTLEVSDPRMWIQGHHVVEVRARVIGEPRTTDPEPLALPFVVDTMAPTGTFEIDDCTDCDRLVIHPHDLISDPTLMQYSVRGPTGQWEQWMPIPDTQRIRPARNHVLDENLGVRVRDEAGNIGELAFHGRTMGNAGGGGCGCDVGGRRHGDGSNPGPALALVTALLLLAGTARRRVLRRSMAIVLRNKTLLQRSMVAMVAGGALIGAVGACGHDEEPGVEPLSKNAQLDPTDEIGRYADALALDGVIRISAYDDNFGDLAYAEVAVADIDKAIAWQWVDGVPMEEGTMPAQDAYRHDTTDPGDDVGLYTSLALTKNKEPRIAYYDRTHRALKYAAGTQHTFTSHTVVLPDAGASPAATAGTYASLSLDAMDVPSIAFMATGIPNGMGGFLSRLRIATAKSPSPAGSGDWTFLDVDQTATSCASVTDREFAKQGLCAAKGEACIYLDPNAMVLDATRSICKKTDAACPMPCGATEACISGTCVKALQPSPAIDLVEGTGLWANLVRLPSGLRTVAYHDRTQGDCKLASETAPGTFTVSFIDGNSPTTDVGQFVTARAGADGTVHVAYVDAVTDRLLYKAVKGGVAPAMPEVIDDGMRPDGPHPVGAGAALWTDGNTVKVAYQDQLLSDLMLATRAGGAWTRGAARMGAPGFGFYPKIVSDGSKLYVTQFVYDRNPAQMNAPLGTLQIAALP